VGLALLFARRLVSQVRKRKFRFLAFLSHCHGEKPWVMHRWVEELKNLLEKHPELQGMIEDEPDAERSPRDFERKIFALDTVEFTGGENLPERLQELIVDSEVFVVFVDENCNEEFERLGQEHYNSWTVMETQFASKYLSLGLCGFKVGEFFDLSKKFTFSLMSAVFPRLIGPFAEDWAWWLHSDDVEKVCAAILEKLRFVRNQRSANLEELEKAFAKLEEAYPEIACFDAAETKGGPPCDADMAKCLKSLRSLLKEMPPIEEKVKIEIVAVQSRQGDAMNLKELLSKCKFDVEDPTPELRSEFFKGKTLVLILDDDYGTIRRHSRAESSRNCFFVGRFSESRRVPANTLEFVEREMFEERVSKMLENLRKCLTFLETARDQPELMLLFLLNEEIENSEVLKSGQKFFHRKTGSLYWLAIRTGGNILGEESEDQNWNPNWEEALEDFMDAKTDSSEALKEYVDNMDLYQSFLCDLNPFELQSRLNILFQRLQATDPRDLCT